MNRIAVAIAAGIVAFTSFYPRDVKAVGDEFIHERQYPGSMCVRWKGPSPSLNFSAIGNPSDSQVLHVDCPIIRELLDLFDVSIDPAIIKAYNRHPTQDIVCTLNSYRYDNNGWKGYSSRPIYSDSEPGLQMFTFQLKSTHPNNTYFSCSLPPGSYILEYIVTEKRF